MYQCDICGRKLKKKNRCFGYTLCSKHMHQYLKHGKFLDNIQRTNSDLNDFYIDGNDAVFNVYNQANVKVYSFRIDKEDIGKIRYHKWRISHKHIVTGFGAENIRELSHILLDIPKEKDNETIVDHIDGDPQNNKKDNLRICTQQNNVWNKAFMSGNTPGFIGVSYDKKRDRFMPEIHTESKRYHLGRYKTLKEAVYVRYYAEGMLFGEFCNEEEHMKKYLFSRDLDEDRKIELIQYIKNKLNQK